MSKFNYPLPGGRFRSLAVNSFLAGVILLLCPGAQSQSSDDVHIPSMRVRSTSDAPSRNDGPEGTADRAPSEHDTRSVLRVKTDLVLVPVTVNDVMNHPVVNLGKQDFELFEAGKPQKISYFSTEDSPISVGVLLDLSYSMSNKIEIAREALRQFFSNSNPDDDYFVLTFADSPHLLADTTQSIDSLEMKLASTKPQGRTALLDAIYMGLSKLHRAKYPRRALFIISDGGDNHSRYGSREIKKLVEESDVEIYAVGIFDTIFKTYEEWAGKRLLNAISEATGGRTIAVADVRQLPDAASSISRELRSHYVLGYRPANSVRDEQFRKIKVQLASPAPATPLHLHFKKGYIGPGN